VSFLAWTCTWSVNPLFAALMYPLNATLPSSHASTAAYVCASTSFFQVTITKQKAQDMKKGSETSFLPWNVKFFRDWVPTCLSGCPPSPPAATRIFSRASRSAASLASNLRCFGLVPFSANDVIQTCKAPVGLKSRHMNSTSKKVQRRLDGVVCQGLPASASIDRFLTLLPLCQGQILSLHFHPEVGKVRMPVKMVRHPQEKCVNPHKI
jgi:hypothetical protein